METETPFSERCRLSADLPCQEEHQTKEIERGRTSFLCNVKVVKERKKTFEYEITVIFVCLLMLKYKLLKQKLNVFHIFSFK